MPKRRNSLMRTVSSGLHRSASLLSRASAAGVGGPTRSASVLSESALLTASDDGDEEQREGSQGAPGRDTRRMSLWSLAGDTVELPPVAGLEDEELAGGLSAESARRRGSADEQ